VVGRPTFLANIRRRQFTAQYVHRQYPLVLLQEAGRRQGRGLGSEEGKMMGSGLLGERDSDVEYLGWFLCLEGEHFDGNVHNVVRVPFWASGVHSGRAPTSTVHVYIHCFLSMYREIIAVCSKIHTKHINVLCGQNTELWMLNLAAHIVTTGLWRVNVHCT